jgi:hypothetical protein
VVANFSSGLTPKCVIDQKISYMGCLEELGSWNMKLKCKAEVGIVENVL